MVIDENPPPESPVDLACRTPPQASPSPRPTVTSNYNNNELKVNNFGQSFADAINICRKESLTAPTSLQNNNNNNNKGRLPQAEQATHTVKFEPQQSALLYPSFPDFSLPFSLSGLIQKKKAEMAAILAPRMSPKPTDTSRLTLDHLSKAAMAVKPPVSPATSHKSHSSSHGGDSTTNTAVSEYENQIQNDLWPIDCIKCTSVLTNLDNFNVHMNDHWSDDKCCPVCGLLINSKRFNFKQHLKIHTGEKPFVCQVCNRAFRQKAHMVSFTTAAPSQFFVHRSGNEFTTSASFLSKIISDHLNVGEARDHPPDRATRSSRIFASLPNGKWGLPARSHCPVKSHSCAKICTHSYIAVPAHMQP